MTDSPYYPPRAGFFSPLWNWVGKLTHSRAVANLPTFPEVTLRGFIAALLIPGMGIYLRKPFAGGVALVACAIYAIVFFVALGFPAGNFAFTALLSIHAVGLASYLQPIIRDSGLFYRLATMIGLVAALVCFAYLPLLHWCERDWLMPIKYHDRTVVLHVGKAPSHLQRGVWIAYRYEGWQRGEIVSQAGVNFAPVLAVSGDEVAFSPTNMLVNGVPQPRLEGMPTYGGLTLPENTWFAWAEFAISGHGYIRSDDVSNARVEQGMIKPEQYVGAPFRWWFWRNQKLP